MYLKKIPWINKVTCLKTKKIVVNSVYCQPIWKGIHILFPVLCNSDKACFWCKVMDNMFVSICFQIVLVHSNFSLCNRTLFSLQWMVTRFDSCQYTNSVLKYSPPQQSSNSVKIFGHNLIITLSEHPKLQHNKHNQWQGHVTLKRGKTKTGKPTATVQCAKKVMSDSPGLVDFAIRLVIFVLSLPNGQVLFLGEIQITEGL